METNLVEAAVDYIQGTLVPGASAILVAMFAVIGLFALWRIIRRALR